MSSVIGPRKPKIPGNAKPRVSAAPGITLPQTVVDHIRIKDFVVGANGIQCSASDWVPPTVRLEDLDKVGKLGGGKQGDVYKYCRKDNPNAKYALKVIRLTPGVEIEKSPIVAELRSALGHRIPNTVTLENAYVRDGNLILIMEYMNYGTLRELMNEVKALNEQVGAPDSNIAGLPENTVAWISSQIVTALHDMNDPSSSCSPLSNSMTEEGVKRRANIHRDIKPENILLTRDGIVKLADFGVATSADSIGASTFVGTVIYMSPERIMGQRHGPSSDVWSLGVVTAEAIMGKFPFAAADAGVFTIMKEIQNTRVVLPTSASESQSFVDRCLEQEGEKRGTATELLSHPWIVKGLTQRDNLKQLIKRCTQARSRHHQQLAVTSSAAPPVAPLSTDEVEASSSQKLKNVST